MERAGRLGVRGAAERAVLERPASAPVVVWPAGWVAGRKRRYGDTRLEFGEVEIA